MVIVVAEVVKVVAALSFKCGKTKGIFPEIATRMVLKLMEIGMVAVEGKSQARLTSRASSCSSLYIIVAAES